MDLARLRASFVENFLPPAEDVQEFREWFFERGSSYVISVLIHTILVVSLALFSYTLISKDNTPTFTAEVVDEPTEDPLEHFKLGEAPLDPTELTTEDLTAFEPPSQTAAYYDDSAEFEEAGGGMKAAEDQPQYGGLGGFSVKDLGPGPAAEGPGGIGASAEDGAHAGVGGMASGFGGRGKGSREEMLGYGGTKASERAVAAALNWFYRHQMPDGSWSLSNFNSRCKGRECSGVGLVEANPVATAFALLPFLAAGQTQKSEGPYQSTIKKGVTWMLAHQSPEGDLAGGPRMSRMYSHGICTIALCECYGMSQDEKVGAAAQKAIQFIEKAQSQTTGGWRYQPGEDGDTSVLGWQLMALKSAQMAGLAVDSRVFDGARKFLKTVEQGESGGMFAYVAYQTSTPTMTAVGLLSRQYLGARRDEPAMLEGRQFLMSHMPGDQLRNTYYWYYATQVMHNFLGPDWDTWNRRMRRLLIETQVKAGCAEGSWDPTSPSPDAWGEQGGRIFTTALSTLTLEIYYRYLPLYRSDPARSATPPAPAQHAMGMR